MCVCVCVCAELHLGRVCKLTLFPDLPFRAMFCLFVCLLACSYYIENGICYMVLCDKDFSKKMAFAFLETLHKEFEVWLLTRRAKRRREEVEEGQPREKETWVSGEVRCVCFGPSAMF